MSTSTEKSLVEYSITVEH